MILLSLRITLLAPLFLRAQFCSKSVRQTSLQQLGSSLPLSFPCYQCPPVQGPAAKRLWETLLEFGSVAALERRPTLTVIQRACATHCAVGKCRSSVHSLALQSWLQASANSWRQWEAMQVRGRGEVPGWNVHGCRWKLWTLPNQTIKCPLSCELSWEKHLIVIIIQFPKKKNLVERPGQICTRSLLNAKKSHCITHRILNAQKYSWHHSFKYFH